MTKFFFYVVAKGIPNPSLALICVLADIYEVSITQGSPVQGFSTEFPSSLTRHVTWRGTEEGVH